MFPALREGALGGRRPGSSPLPSQTTGFEFFEASAKDNINVKQTFERLVDVICEKMNESLEPSSGPGSNGKGPALGDTPPPEPSGCSC